MYFVTSQFVVRQRQVVFVVSVVRQRQDKYYGNKALTSSQENTQQHLKHTHICQQKLVLSASTPRQHLQHKMTTKPPHRELFHLPCVWPATLFFFFFLTPSHNRGRSNDVGPRLIHTNHIRPIRHTDTQAQSRTHTHTLKELHLTSRRKKKRSKLCVFTRARTHSCTHAHALSSSNVSNALPLQLTSISGAPCECLL